MGKVLVCYRVHTYFQTLAVLLMLKYVLNLSSKLFVHIHSLLRGLKSELELLIV